MGKYMDNPSLDVMITAIVNKEMEEYKSKILNGIEEHFEIELKSKFLIKLKCKELLIL